MNAEDRKILCSAAPSTEKDKLSYEGDALVDYDRRFASSLLFQYGEISGTSEFAVVHGKFAEFVQKEPYVLPKQNSDDDDDYCAVYEIIVVVAPMTV